MGEFFQGMGMEAAGTSVVLVLLVSILGLVMRSIVKGDLVTRAQHERELADKDAQIASWREVASTESARADVVTEQNTQLINGSRTALDVIEALRSVAQQRAGEAT